MLLVTWHLSRQIVVITAPTSHGLCQRQLTVIALE